MTRDGSMGLAVPARRLFANRGIGPQRRSDPLRALPGSKWKLDAETWYPPTPIMIEIPLPAKRVTSWERSIRRQHRQVGDVPCRYPIGKRRPGRSIRRGSARQSAMIHP